MRWCLIRYLNNDPIASCVVNCGSAPVQNDPQKIKYTKPLTNHRKLGDFEAPLLAVIKRVVVHIFWTKC